MKMCQHPADRRSRDMLLLRCPDCGAECSETQIGDDQLCYDEHCPLHVMASPAAQLGRLGGRATAAAMTPEQRSERASAAAKRRWSDATPEQRAAQGARLAQSRKQ